MGPGREHCPHSKAGPALPTRLSWTTPSTMAVRGPGWQTSPQPASLVNKAAYTILRSPASTSVCTDQGVTRRLGGHRGRSWHTPRRLCEVVNDTAT